MYQYIVTKERLGGEKGLISLKIKWTSNIVLYHFTDYTNTYFKWHIDILEYQKEFVMNIKSTKYDFNDIPTGCVKSANVYSGSVFHFHS